MQRLDKEIEEVLGKAVTNNDLETLYKMDLKAIGEICKDGKHEALRAVAENVAATKVQAVARGNAARQATAE